MIEINNISGFQVDSKNLQRIGDNFLNYYNKNDYNVSLAIIDDDRMREINLKYKNRDRTTDVLSFESSEKEKSDEKFLGEILISYAQVKRQAKEFNRKLQDELNFIFIHGLLHLLGYTDDIDEKRQEMIDLGNNFLREYEQNRS